MNSAPANSKELLLEVKDLAVEFDTYGGPFRQFVVLISL